MKFESRYNNFHARKCIVIDHLQNGGYLVSSLSTSICSCKPRYISYSCSRVDGTDRQQQHSPYQSYGMACTEVELDVLTGEYVLRRADVLYDCGKR